MWDRHRVYYRTALTIFQGIFLFSVFTLLLCWILPKIKGQFLKLTEKSDERIEEKNCTDLNKIQQKEQREKFQKDFNLKAADYRDRVLTPRALEKRRQKEEKFFKFLGPSWKGKGSPLGGENEDEICNLTDAEKAAKRRIVQENINYETLSLATAQAAQRSRIKQVIKLPEEPTAEEQDIITILFRSPLGTSFQRRFHTTDHLQLLFDFITTKGFSPKTYVILTSYPRMLLNNSKVCLSELNFGKRIVLNIEEKDA